MPSEIIRVLEMLHSSMSYGAIGHELNVNQLTLCIK